MNLGLRLAGNMVFFGKEPPASALMRHAAWARHHQGMQRLTAIQKRTSHLVIPSHLSAARLLGLPEVESITIPDLSPAKSNQPLEPDDFQPEWPPIADGRKQAHACVPSRANLYHLVGVYTHIWPPVSEPSSLIALGDMMTSSPEAVFAQLAATFELPRLVLLGDAMICRDRRLRCSSKDRICAFLKASPAFRGKKKCWRALNLMEPGTDSPYETLLRLILLSSGLPLPQVNYRIGDGTSFFVDLAYPEHKVGIEYNGTHHHEQISEDLKRQNALISRGWKVLFIEHSMIQSPQGRRTFVMQVRRALNRGEAGLPSLNPRSYQELSDSRHWKKASQ